MLALYDDKRNKLYSLKQKIEEIFILAIKKVFENERKDKVHKDHKIDYGYLLYKDSIIDIIANNRSYSFVNETLYPKYNHTYKKYHSFKF